MQWRLGWCGRNSLSRERAQRSSLELDHTRLSLRGVALRRKVRLKRLGLEAALLVCGRAKADGARREGLPLPADLVAPPRDLDLRDLGPMHPDGVQRVPYLRNVLQFPKRSRMTLLPRLISTRNRCHAVCRSGSGPDDTERLWRPYRVVGIHKI